MALESSSAAHPWRTLWLDDAGVVKTLDQTRLPFAQVEIALTSLEDCARAIETMQVRGAPLIGATAAIGLALALREAPDEASLQRAATRLAATRPTAVNLHWALARVADAVVPLAMPQRARHAWAQALAIVEEDVAVNAAIGEQGAALARAHFAWLAQAPGAHQGRALQWLTHCNAGRLATVAHGTALAPIYALHAAGVAQHVWVDETRPRNQGASLTAWELGQAGIAHTVIADNAGGQLMRAGAVDVVIVGCDRVARNGDVANKIGTYLKALAARDCGLPFWVACPASTFDPSLVSGAEIPIEERSAREVTHFSGRNERGEWTEVQVTPDGSPARNPAFDVTPARLVDALITERGVCAASEAGLAALWPQRFAR